MDDKFVLDVGLAADLKAGFKRAGWETEEIKKLSSGDTLTHVRGFVRGKSNIVPVESGPTTATNMTTLPSGLVVVHRSLEVDCDLDVMPPDWKAAGWECRPEDQIASRIRGQLIFDPAQFKRVLKLNEGEPYVVGHELKTRLEGELVLPDNLLEAWLQYPEFIPAECRQGRTYFWGKIYRDGDSLCVRFLYLGGGVWGWDCCWLDDGFFSGHPAAVLASTPPLVS